MFFVVVCLFSFCILLGFPPHALLFYYRVFVLWGFLVFFLFCFLLGWRAVLIVLWCGEYIYFIFGGGGGVFGVFFLCANYVSFLLL